MRNFQHLSQVTIRIERDSAVFFRNPNSTRDMLGVEAMHTPIDLELIVQNIRGRWWAMKMNDGRSVQRGIPIESASEEASLEQLWNDLILTSVVGCNSRGITGPLFEE